MSVRQFVLALFVISSAANYANEVPLEITNENVKATGGSDCDLKVMVKVPMYEYICNGRGILVAINKEGEAFTTLCQVSNVHPAPSGGGEFLLHALRTSPGDASPCLLKLPAGGEYLLHGRMYCWTEGKLGLGDGVEPLTVTVPACHSSP